MKQTKAVQAQTLILTKSKKINDFIVKIQKDLNNYGVTLQLHHADWPKFTTTGKITKEVLHGFFDPTSKCLAIGIQEDVNVWLPTLVHEYAHFLQWKDQDKLWLHFDEYVTVNGIKYTYGSLFWDWLDGKINNVDDETITIAANIIRDLEFNADHIAYQIIKTLKLPISLNTYKRQAIAHAYSYMFAAEFRVWPTTKFGHSVYENPDILKNIKTRHWKKLNNKLPIDLQKLILKKA